MRRWAAAFYTAVERLGVGSSPWWKTWAGWRRCSIDVLRWAVRPPFRVHNLFAQLDFVGVGSIFIVGAHRHLLGHGVRPPELARLRDVQRREHGGADGVAHHHPRAGARVLAR